jgi:opacity protein-like surface antigen
MVRRTLVVLVGCFFLTTTSALAQQIEASASIGYSASEGISVDQRSLLGQQYDTLAVDSGASFNFTGGVLFNQNMEAQFLFARQNSRLQADGAAGRLPISELAVYNYMFNFVYNVGGRDAKIRPYFFGGLGATDYSFGQNLLTGSTGNIPGETRFATNWGGGVKYFVAPAIGLQAGLRWTPTYIKSNTTGIWCDPFYGCWPLVNNEYSNQFETSFGVTFRVK